MSMLTGGFRKLAGLLGGKGPLFQALEVEISSACNLRCGTCPVKHHQRPQAELPTGVIEAMVAELASLGYAGTFSPHFYNEPLLDKRLPSILGLVRSRLPRVTINLFTNFTLMTPELYRTLLPLVDSFIVTVDQPAIERAVERVRRELDAGELAKLRTRSIQGSALTNRAGAIAADPATMRKLEHCDYPQSALVVDATGDAHLCCNDYFSQAVYGNVKEKGLAEIWHDPAFTKDRQLGSCVRHPLCRNCLWTVS